MKENEQLADFTENLEQYLHSNYELLKYQATERSSSIGSGLISGLLVTLVVAFFSLFISLGAAFYISARFGNSYSGFLFVGGFYLLAGIILIVSRKKLVERPVRNKIIRKILSKN